MNKRLKAFLVPVIVLTLVSAAVAMWYDILKIHAAIDTGEVDVKFGGKPYVTENDWGKSVAECSAEILEYEDEDPKNPTGNNDLDLVITIRNAYPCYYCKVEDLYVVNVGTIPVKLSIEVYARKEGGDWYKCKLETLWGQDVYKCDADNDNKVDLVLWGCFTTLKGRQIDPDETGSFTVDLHVQQDAKEGQTYEVQILIKAIQWNEYE